MDTPRKKETIIEAARTGPQLVVHTEAHGWRLFLNNMELGFVDTARLTEAGLQEIGPAPGMAGRLVNSVGVHLFPGDGDFTVFAYGVPGLPAVVCADNVEFQTDTSWQPQD